MTSASSFALRRLRDEYDRQHPGGYLTGADQLYRLGRLAMDASRALTGEPKVGAFTLGRAFLGIAERIDGTPFEAAGSALLFGILDQPIRQSLDRLIEGQPAADALADLVGAYHQAADEISNRDTT